MSLYDWMHWINFGEDKYAEECFLNAPVRLGAQGAGCAPPAGYFIVLLDAVIGERTCTLDTALRLADSAAIPRGPL